MNISHKWHVVISFMPLAINCGIIFALSAMSHPPIPGFMLFEGSDKVLHCTAYAAVGFSALWHYYYLTGRCDAESIIKSILFSAVYGLSDEVHQLFVPYRQFDLLDFAADVFGASLGMTVLFWWSKLKLFKSAE